MKKTLFPAILISLFLLGSCEKKAADPAEGFTMDKDTSYAVGMVLALQFQSLQSQMLQSQPTDLHMDYQALAEGFKAVTEARETQFSVEDGFAKLDAAFAALRAKEDEKNQVQGPVNLEEGQAFLAENGARAEVTTLPSGLQYEVITEGAGAKPAATDTVQVHYEGTLLDGTVFDSSYARNQPAEFALNQVIPGWTEGLQLMNEGSTYKLYIPADLAYGARGSGSIPPQSTLIFKVELLAVVK